MIDSGRSVKIPCRPAFFWAADFLRRAFRDVFQVTFKRRQIACGGREGVESRSSQLFCFEIFDSGL